ncbi:hypothetical protein [Gemmatimonas sp.]|uniref:hypothetical protein n=1 Tax=Gemmatimonas sp. TaxID=1962908 RepID=UPI00333E996B
MLAAMAVLAGATLPPTGSPTGAPLEILGEALMMLSDLFDTVLSPEGADHSTSEGRLQWTHYFAVVAFTSGDDDMVHAVVRTAEIFVDSHDALRDDPDYIDLAALFEQATGLSINGYMLVMVSLLVKLFAVNAKNAANESAVIPKAYFSDFSPILRERFLALAGRDSTRFCEAATETWKPGQLRPLSLLPAEQSPVVHFEEGSVCLSVRLLEEKLTSGLYHVLLNARPGDEHKKFRARYQRFIGRVFERYVERAGRRIAAHLAERSGWHPRERFDGVPARFISEQELRNALNSTSGPTPSFCDAALVVGQDIILIECKAQFFSLPSRTGEAPEQFFSRLREIVVDGVRQLNETLKLIVAGRLQSLGLRTERIRRVFPVVVSLEELPICADVRAWIDTELAEACVMPEARIGPAIVFAPEFFCARDLEWLEAVVEHTNERPGNLIARKHSKASWYGVSPATWGHIAKVLPGDRHATLATHHLQRWEKLNDEMRQFFREQTTGRAGGDQNGDDEANPGGQ